MVTNETAIHADQLTKRYGQVMAVDRVSFTVRQGEIFGFLGPNGAGKTTTIRMLTGIIQKDAGFAAIMGYPAGSIRAKQLSGVVPEMANVYVDLSAWDNLMLMARLYRTPLSEARKRADYWLARLGLYERRNDRARTYSMGMKKRLLLAMALINNPQVLFLDEPTGGLDVQSARAIRAILRDLKRTGITIMLTTHNMEEAALLCDRIAIINRGRLIAVDAPEKISTMVSRIHLVEVSLAQPVSAEVLAELAGVKRVEPLEAAQGDGSVGSSRRFRLHTEETTLLVTALVDWARANSVHVNILNISPPSLEEAFLRLTEGEKARNHAT